MPIYEFYCAACHTVFNFRSRRIDTETRPNCPRCARPQLERQVSRFAISKGRPDGGDGDGGDGEPDPFAGVDEARMEKALESLAGEMDRFDEDDPRQAASMMRRLFDATGLEHGAGMEEALRRLEAGEDPEQIENDLGDVLENEQDEVMLASPQAKLNRLRQRLRPPQVDDKLYDLPV